VIYTTNAIESLNRVIRKPVKNCKVFPNDNAAMKVIYLAVEAASKKWSSCPWGTMQIRHWKAASNRFIASSGTELIEFKDQLAPHVYTGQLHSLFTASHFSQPYSAR
jgi:transposase-like protein